jgi:hypothetical protein
MALNYHYYYRCAQSSETRGNRPGNEGGCGHWNTYSCAREITDDYEPQSSPCKNPCCNDSKPGRRMRLNRGIVHESPLEMFTRTNDNLNDLLTTLMPRERRRWVALEVARLNQIIADGEEECHSGHADAIRGWSMRSHLSDYQEFL